MTSKGVSTERVLTELLRSAACTVLVVLVIIGIVFVTGEDFHQNVGMVMRMVLLPVGLIRALLGPIELSLISFSVIEFVYFFVIVSVARLLWRVVVPGVK